MEPQQPPGYGAPNQPQQQPQPPQQGQHAPPPQYGAPQYGAPQYAQQPYYPPQKKGFPAWAIVLIVLGVVFFVVLPIMALAAIPLITTNTRDARQSEGEQMMNSMKGQARVGYSKMGTAPLRLTGSIDSGGSGVSTAELLGKYYNVDDRIQNGVGHDARITCSPVQTQSDGRGQLDFNWGGGDGITTWTD